MYTIQWVLRYLDTRYLDKLRYLDNFSPKFTIFHKNSPNCQILPIFQKLGGKITQYPVVLPTRDVKGTERNGTCSPKFFILCSCSVPFPEIFYFCVPVPPVPRICVPVPFRSQKIIFSLFRLVPFSEFFVPLLFLSLKVSKKLDKYDKIKK